MPRHRRGWALEVGDGNRSNRHSPVAVSFLEPALLILLKEQPRHGYTLLADLAELGLNTLHPSVIYRTLRDLEDLEWIQSTWDTDQTQGPPRRTYQLTPLGELALQNWQQEFTRTQHLIMQLLQRISRLD